MQTKYLGVITTSDLRWTDHLSHAIRKANQKTGFLRRFLGDASLATKLLTYKTYERLAIEYVATVWDPHTRQNQANLENARNIAVHFI